ncbi:hypothetical protein [Bradyrhizobium sp. 150]|uniref:hypothetical protein n=1 Tax=Bradyrhizobium sp. 150 TaxID=2782625 RepID=UPI001FFA9513|nr:hypothetical protein [Bradyrhizobium sp. 150]MCK1671050.1 hypothetical protein [Bradyrhizobium sp. 150]
MARPELATVFEHIWLPVGEDGKRQRGVVARCGKCDSAISLPVNTMSKAGAQSDEAEWRFISSKLAMKDWEVGRRRRDHRCPRCIRNAKLLCEPDQAPGYSFQSNTGEAMPAGNLRLVKDAFMNSTMPTTTPVPPPPKARPAAASDVRTMERGDKTAIYDLLKEVYLSDKVGYSDGWSDQKLAEKLGVPRAWVATIRDEFFGEEITSENVRERVKDAHELLAKIRALQPAIDEARKLLGLADTMERELAQIAKVMK